MISVHTSMHEHWMLVVAQRALWEAVWARTVVDYCIDDTSYADQWNAPCTIGHKCTVAA